MKLVNSILLLFSLMLHTYSAARFNFMPQIGNSFQRSIMLSGLLKFPHTIENPPIVYIFYKGDEYKAQRDLKAGQHSPEIYFELYEDKEPQELFVIITDYLNLPADSSIEHLETSPDHMYRYFKLSKNSYKMTTTQSDSKKQESPEHFACWKISELDNKTKKIIIPDNTIIVFMKPTLIDTLISEPWRADSNIITLPTIVFKSSVTQDIISDIEVRMACAVLDFNVMHKKPQKTSVSMAQNRIVSLPATRSLC